MVDKMMEIVDRWRDGRIQQVLRILKKEGVIVPKRVVEKILDKLEESDEL